jgi:hypothetical protein
LGFDPRVSGHVGFSAKLVLENRHFLAKPAVSWSNQLDKPLGARAPRQSAGEPIAKSAKVSKYQKLAPKSLKILDRRTELQACATDGRLQFDAR